MICAKLYYDDSLAAIEWLERAFGFKRRLVVPGAGREIVHAEMSLGDDVIFLGSSRPEQNCVSPRRLAGVTHVLCVRVDDPDAHCARARAAGAEITQAPMNESNGGRGYGARDPEGNRWHFGTYVPGAQWSE
jgi:uncharacterized glyoxalase superfamily protein PhnB